MDAIHLLKQEHEHAKQVFAQIRRGSGKERGQLWTKLKPELKAHEQMEERALYGPIARAAGADEQLKQWEEHHQEEVAELESLVQDIDGVDPMSDDWIGMVETLQAKLEHHIGEEEGTIWPRIQQTWDRSRLEQAGEQMEGMKRQRQAA